MANGGELGGVSASPPEPGHFAGRRGLRPRDDHLRSRRAGSLGHCGGDDRARPRPGGIVAARDGDYAGFVWLPDIPALHTWLEIYQRTARNNGGEPNAGRRLHSWARAAGFTDITATSSTWCFATPEDRAWWGGMWADRVLESGVARQALTSGLATEADLQRISDGWREWADAEDGWISILHGEILCRA